MSPTLLTWNMSGHGPISMDLASIKALAIASGFVMPSSSTNGTHPNPHRPKADLQRMFAHYGVSSPTAFKHLFYVTRLAPPTDAATPPRPPPHNPHEPTWRWLQRPNYLYVGQLLYGLPNGLGWHCTRTPTGVVQYWGTFAHGLSDGLGEHINERGDKVNGYFRRGEACGPGVLEYGGGSLRSNHVGARRLRFEGMLRHGVPGGRGVFVWASHGGARGKPSPQGTLTMEYGEFDDQRAVCTLQEAACATMVALAKACAAAARKVRREVKQSLSTHGLSDMVSQMPSPGPLPTQRPPTPTLDVMCGAAAQAAATGHRRGQGKRLMT